MLGVIISTMALFIVLSAFSGLIQFNELFLNVADPDIKIQTTKGKTFQLKDSIIQLLKSKEIIAYSEILEEHALLENNDKRTVVSLKGVDNMYTKVNKMDTTLYIGDWFSDKEKNAVVLGLSIANKLETIPNAYGENLKIYVPKPGKGQLNLNSFNKIRTQTIGIFRLTPEMDEKFVFAPLNLVQNLLNKDKQTVSAIEIKLSKNIKPNNFKLILEKKLGKNFSVKTRKELNESTYKMLNLEHFFSYLIASLIGVIAFFNVIGAIIMMILDKKEDLKTLANMGLETTQIKRIFLYQGFLLTIKGMFIGLILAIAIVLLQIKFGFIKINAVIAYPVAFKFTNILIVIGTILGLGSIASYIASSRVNLKLLKS